MHGVTGLHHITAIAGPPQENLDFYAGVLGLRLVKKSVNQDDPGTYHLFYADAEGRPGTDLTFFPWTQAAPSRRGHGLTVEVQFAVPPDSLGYWTDRLERYAVRIGAAETRFGERALPFVDPHGLDVALVESDGALRRPFTPWDDSTVPAGHQIRGLHSARLWERDLATTAGFLTSVLGLTRLATEHGWHRFAVQGQASQPDARSAGEGAVSGRFVDIRETPDIRRGAWGVGSVHHIAWRVDDEAHQLEVRSRVDAAGRRPTPVIDRFWFRSVYFLEPGGVLFELATDGPGFAVDEDMARLGERLVLPPWLESSRRDIEAKLPRLVYPVTVGLLALALAAPAAAHRVATPAQGAGAAETAAAQAHAEPGDLARAQRLIEAGSFEEAVALLRGVVERRPDDADARLLLGAALALVPRRSEAIMELTEAVRLRPDFAPGYNALGMALSRFVEPDRARRAFEKAIALDPELAQARVNLALLLVQAGEADDADEQLTKAIEIEGNSPSAAYPQYLKGLIAAEQDRLDDAVRLFERAVALRPGYAEAFLQIGLAQRRLMDFEGAVRALQEAVRLAPDNADARYELGKELLRAERPAQAVDHLQHAVRADPEDSAALYNLARALRRADRSSEAEEAEARLREIRRQSARANEHAFQATALNNEGVELEEAGDVEAAIERYAAALELDPLNTVFRRNFALAFCRIGRWAEGLAELEEVLRLDPEDEEATKARYIALEEVKKRGKG